MVRAASPEETVEEMATPKPDELISAGVPVSPHASVVVPYV
jgi:hypothetical protein